MCVYLLECKRERESEYIVPFAILHHFSLTQLTLSLSLSLMTLDTFSRFREGSETPVSVERTILSRKRIKKDERKTFRRKSPPSLPPSTLYLSIPLTLPLSRSLSLPTSNTLDLSTDLSKTFLLFRLYVKMFMCMYFYVV